MNVFLADDLTRMHHQSKPPTVCGCGTLYTDRCAQSLAQACVIPRGALSIISSNSTSALIAMRRRCPATPILPIKVSNKKKAK